MPYYYEYPTPHIAYFINFQCETLFAHWIIISLSFYVIWKYFSSFKNLALSKNNYRTIPEHKLEEKKNLKGWEKEAIPKYFDDTLKSQNFNYLWNVVNFGT